MAQIHSNLSAINILGAGVVMMDESCHALLTFKIDAGGKRMQTEEAFVTGTRNERYWPHPVWFWFIQVFPTIACSIAHNHTSQINLKPLPSMLLH